MTVIDSTAMAADAWATALSVLGPEEGLALAEARGMAALFIIRADDDFAMASTSAMRKFIGVH